MKKGQCPRKSRPKRDKEGGIKMIKKVAILANGGDVAGFNAVIRGIVKTA